VCAHAQLDRSAVSACPPQQNGGRQEHADDEKPAPLIERGQAIILYFYYP